MNLCLKLQSPEDYKIFAAGFPYGKLGMDLLDPCKSYHHHLAASALSTPSHDISQCRSVHIHTPNEAAIRLALNILNALPSQDVCDRLLDRYVVFEDLITHKPTLTFAHKSLRDTYGPYLTAPKDPKKPSFVSEKMCRNAFCLPGDSPTKNRHTWLVSFTGDNFRWEILGMLVALFGLAAISLPDWDPLLTSQDESRNDRRKFACDFPIDNDTDWLDWLNNADWTKGSMGDFG
ncbi:hypothetical protein HO173_003693 [Letharia columbiana]|uniref:Uncharacterized protein n=1 Tax=Letharia columbiana TaxID=112416 RepID=A0A8H6G037_9LECA|nr:uncharacterized protein HO173_003693 [Letharia columbiana]KAF6238059.1 hypothetical protein HO173_003693 [Letharia columbiana]